MKNVVVAGLVAFGLVGCGSPSAEDAGAVPVVEEAAPEVEVVEEAAPAVEEAPAAEEATAPSA